MKLESFRVFGQCDECQRYIPAEDFTLNYYVCDCCFDEKIHTENDDTEKRFIFDDIPF